MGMPAKWYACLALGTSLVLAGCGGSDGSGSGGTSNGGPATTTLTGTAATGAAMTSGTVELSCKDGLQKAGIPISATGTWSATVPTVNLPCAVKASDGTNTYYSFTVGNGNSIVVNVTPLTTLVLAQILGTTPSSLFASLSATDLAKINTSAIDAAISALNAALAQYALPAGFNPVTTPLIAAAPGQAGNAYDGLLDQFNDANADLSALIAGAATGTMPTLATPSYTPAATSLSEFFTRFAGSYTLKVNTSGAEGVNNHASVSLFPQDAAIDVQLKSNGDVIVKAVGRNISYLASTYAGNTTGANPFARTDFNANESGMNVLRYRSADGFLNELLVGYEPGTGTLNVDLVGFVNGEGSAVLRGRIVAPPAALPPPALVCTDLIYSGSNNDRYSNNQSVCFTTISTSTLAVGGKTLTNPTQMAMTAPYSAWKFVDGNYSYEVIFNGSALHEINLSFTGGAFQGQFAASSPAVGAPTISSFSPASGAVGSTVTITGTGFSSTPAANVVRFSTTFPGPAPQATVVSGSSTQLVVTVPAGAMTGQISVYNGNAVVGSSSSFTVTAGAVAIPTTLAGKLSAPFAGTYVLSCYSNGSGSALVERTVVVNADGSSTLDGNPVISTGHGGYVKLQRGASGSYSYQGFYHDPVSFKSTYFKLSFKDDGALVTDSNRSHLANVDDVGGSCTGISGPNVGSGAINMSTLPALIGSYALTDTLTCSGASTPLPAGLTTVAIDSDGTLRAGSISLTSAQYVAEGKAFTIQDGVSIPGGGFMTPAAISFSVGGEVADGSGGMVAGGFFFQFDKDKNATNVQVTRNPATAQCLP